MTTKKSRAKHLDRPADNGLPNILTGVPGLDAVLGGGVPEFSMSLIAGSPGAGKTTLAQQIMFANATDARPALYFTVLGEPTLKMLRYQKEFGFFDPALVGSAVQYVNLSDEAVDHDLSVVLERMIVGGRACTAEGGGRRLLSYCHGPRRSTKRPGENESRCLHPAPRGCR